MSRTRNTNEAKKGLYYNVNKRKKAGTSRKKGHPDAPSDQDWKNAAKTAKKSTNEGLADMAHMVERDHEVQMARADLYKIAKYAIKLHDMLKGVSEAEGIQGWQQAKITKASDYISAVYHNLDYDMKFNGAGELGESADHCAHCGCEVGNPKPGCDCKEDCHSPVKESKDKYCSDKCCGSDVKAEDCKCPPTCKHCNCNAVNEGKKKYKSAAQRKAIHANKIKEGLADPYKNRLHQKLAEKSESKAQQQAAGIALAAKRKGEKPKGKGAAAQMAKMSTKDLEDFAKTKHKGLPKYKKK